MCSAAEYFFESWDAFLAAILVALIVIEVRTNCHISKLERQASKALDDAIEFKRQIRTLRDQWKFANMASAATEISDGDV